MKRVLFGKKTSFYEKVPHCFLSNISNKLKNLQIMLERSYI